jgi:hypothetical protein
MNGLTLNSIRETKRRALSSVNELLSVVENGLPSHQINQRIVVQLCVWDSWHHQFGKALIVASLVVFVA